MPAVPQQQQQHQQQQRQGNFGIQAAPTSFPALNDFSTEELQRMVTDRAAYEAFLQSQDQVKQLQQVIDDLNRGNLELARKNLGRESELNELRTQCRIIRGTELAAGKERIESLQKREREAVSTFTPVAWVNQLDAAAKASDKHSEELLHDQFLRGKVEWGEFMSCYRRLRTHVHMRNNLHLAALTSLTGPP
eukprot:TRINITY_DN757_c0_g1_i2.p1 TRINITY_DN757_c0_g1~~TRINITY_DN757_c0_g1_i2.p1  ORF type:complete len:192 (-),score=52.71 TRINITY_DN757_c0_g1_i2:58-633(-)